MRNSGTERKVSQQARRNHQCEGLPNPRIGGFAFCFQNRHTLVAYNKTGGCSSLWIKNSEGTQAIFLKFVSLHGHVHGGVSFSTYHVCVRVLYASVRLSSHPLSESQSLSVDSHLHC